MSGCRECPGLSRKRCSRIVAQVLRVRPVLRLEGDACWHVSRGRAAAVDVRATGKDDLVGLSSNASNDDRHAQLARAPCGNDSHLADLHRSETEASYAEFTVRYKSLAYTRGSVRAVGSSIRVRGPNNATGSANSKTFTCPRERFAG